LLVGGGLGAGSFFFRRWFGVFPLLPRFFLLHSRFSWGFFMTFCFVFLLNIFSSHFFNIFCFLSGDGGIGNLIGVGDTFSFLRELHGWVRRMQIVM
jgi:hypothetical protein